MVRAGIDEEPDEAVPTMVLCIDSRREGERCPGDEAKYFHRSSPFFVAPGMSTVEGRRCGGLCGDHSVGMVRRICTLTFLLVR